MQQKHPAQEVVHFRMTQAAYDQLVKRLPAISINETTTPLQAAFQLGVQKVLETLRKEYVV